MCVGASGVDRVFSVGAAAQVGWGTEATEGGMAIWGAGRSADMPRVLSVSFGDRWAFSVFGA